MIYIPLHVPLFDLTLNKGLGVNACGFITKSIKNSRNWLLEISKILSQKEVLTFSLFNNYTASWLPSQKSAAELFEQVETKTGGSKIKRYCPNDFSISEMKSPMIERERI